MKSAFKRYLCLGSFRAYPGEKTVDGLEFHKTFGKVKQAVFFVP